MAGWRLALTFLVVAALPACGGGQKTLVLYCGVDQDQSRPMAERFAREKGLDLEFHGEVEASRSVGLPQRLLLERNAPRADAYWSNEIIHMVDLAESGLIVPLPSDLVEAFPPAWRDPKGRFLQFGARARILLVNTTLLPNAADRPRRVRDLLDPRYVAMGLRTAMARPLTGTTYTHAVALLTHDEKAAWTFLAGVEESARQGHLKLVNSNGQVARVVREGTDNVAFGLTDTDDAWAAIQAGYPVAVIYPDQGEEELGTVVIPNTAAIVRGAPHPEAALEFLRWLSRPKTEELLAFGLSAQIPVRPGVPVPSDGHVKRPGVDFRAAATDWIACGRNVRRWLDPLIQRFRPAN